MRITRQRHGLPLLCALWAGPALGAEGSETRYRFELRLKTEMAEAPEGAREVLGAGEWRLKGELTVAPTRRFRDGSIGRRLRFESVEERADGEETSRASEMEGRTVDLRSFEDGEVLDVSEGRQIAGWGQGGDLLDVLLPMVSPAPPKLKKDRVSHRRLIWPFRVDRTVRWDSAVEADWRQRRASSGDDGVSVLAYEGPFSLDGYDRRTRNRIRYTGTGQLRGEIALDRDGQRRHVVLLERVIVIAVNDVTVVSQKQRIEVSLHRIQVGEPVRLQASEDVPGDARYLGLTQVHQTLKAASARISACDVSGPDLSLPVHLEITGDGGVVRLQGASEVPCVNNVLSALRFPDHDGSDAQVRLTVYRRAGTVSLSPVVELVSKPVGPVLVHPVRRWPAGRLQEAARALGHPLSETRSADR